jgi:putative ABC transport system ATP-binding protein
MSASTDLAPRVAVAGVHLAFAGDGGPRPVLTGVDLEVREGEVVAIAGRSGSGKTTLLIVIAGLVAPDVGTASVLGRRADDAHPWYEVALLPQSLGLLDELTVEENIALPSRLHSSDSPRDLADLLDRLGLARLARRFPSEISFGEQQRTALARAVIGGPRVLLADEPISHQNHEWAEVSIQIVAELAEAGTSCLLATHNELAFTHAHRVLELRDGRLSPRQ